LLKMWGVVSQCWFMCLSVRCHAIQHAYTLYYPRPSWAVLCTGLMDNPSAADKSLVVAYQVCKINSPF
jgi:hypothetical protein